MARASMTFRIFVSSTFSDLKEERSALQERVFPRLRELCAQRGARFQAIDLRWGVAREAAFDQQTLNICFEEIDRCRGTTPRPNFIVLLGDRYGWRPPPPQIPGYEYEEIVRRVPPDERQLMEEWYARDDNALREVDGRATGEYRLKDRVGPNEDHDTWTAVEGDLARILRAAVKDMPLGDDDRLKYEASATEQEIARGALRVEGPVDHVHCFFRTIRDLPHSAIGREFVDLVESDAEYALDQEASSKLEALKAKLRNLLPRNIHEYEARWAGSEPTTDHLGDLCEDVYQHLRHAIEQEIEQLEEANPVKQEIKEHAAFGRKRAEVFIGRTAALQSISDYLREADPHTLAVHGSSGSGKSALMAKAAERVQDDLPDAQVIVRFIGATPGSSDGRSLLHSLCRELSRRYGADEASVPSAYQELVEEFPRRLALATADRPLVVFVDALDQLSDADYARSLVWLPSELPDHVRLVVSTLPGECLDALERRLPASNLVKVEPMPPEEGDELLAIWLRDAGRTLQSHQQEEVLGKFNEDGLPLYLRLAFEEARRWRSYTDPEETELSPDIPGVIRDLFARLSAEENHGEVLVSRALGYLVAARNGLAEDELMDILSAHEPDELEKDTVLADFLRRSPDSPDVDRLPVVVWSRLYFDLEPYLAERSGDGTALLGFYHRQLREVAAEDYLAGAEARQRHRALAQYFGKQELAASLDDAATPVLRKLSELPFQQTHGELWDELYETLTNFTFLEQKVATGATDTADAEGGKTRTYSGVFALQEDFRLGLEKWPGGGRGGLGSGPRRRIIVTAVDFGEGDGHVIRCPFCNKSSPLREEWLGQEIECPTEGCGGPLKVNPFKVGGNRE